MGWGDRAGGPTRRDGRDAPAARAGRRIVVVGTSGSGKTTFARRLAAGLGIPHVELDALHWEPEWTEASDEVLRARVAEATAQDAWVVDGNYSRVRGILWPRASAVIWLDYPLRTILTRVLLRTLRRVFTREELWNGNRERFFRSVFGRESIIRWALRTYRTRRREYPALFARPEYAHLSVVRLRSPRGARRWLAGFQAARAEPPRDRAAGGE